MRNEINELILHLLVNHSTSIEMIEKDLTIKKSEVKEYLYFLNKHLECEGEETIKIDRNENVNMGNETYKFLYHMLKTSKFINLDYLTPEIRMNLVIIKLLTDQSYFSLQDLADFVDVSKNTILTDMKAIKERVATHFAQVEYSRNDGYKITGSEYNLRKLLVTELKALLLHDFAIALLEKKKMIEKNELFLLEKRLIKVEKNLEISFTDEQLEHLPIILTLLIKRINEFKRNWVSEIEGFDIENTKEYQILKKMFWGTNELSEKDKLYLSLQVLSSNMLESALDISRGEDLKYAVSDFLDIVEQNLAIELIRRTELKQRLILHLRPAIYRTWLRLSIRNPLMEQFIEEYYSLYSIISKSVHPLENFVGKSFSKEEIVYIAMHIQAWIYGTKEQKEYVFKAMVVCRNGTSVSKFLLETLKGMFPNFEFIGAFAERGFKKHVEEIDFIFSTVPLNTFKKTFIVSPILNKENRISLKRQVQRYIDKDSNKKARALVHHIKEFLPVDDYEKVKQKIVEFFNESMEINSTESSMEQREHLFNFRQEHILFTDKEMNWKEALDFALQPMEERKSINNRYSTKVKEIFKEDSCRMMVGPSVYLPHARPCEGVLKEDFSILICNHKVVMPHGELAKVIVVLAPEDNNHHVKTLLALNETFLDDEKANKIFQATTEEEVLEVINN